MLFQTLKQFWDNYKEVESHSLLESLIQKMYRYQMEILE